MRFSGILVCNGEKGTNILQRIKITFASLRPVQGIEWSWDQLAASSPWCLTPVGRECLVACPLPGQRGRVFTDIPLALPLQTWGLLVIALLPESSLV